MKKIFKSDTFWILFIIFGFSALVWYRISHFYDKVLDGTKYQIHRKDYRPNGR